MLRVGMCDDNVEGLKIVQKFLEAIKKKINFAS